MSVATIKLVNGELLGSFYFTKNPAELAQKLLREGRYKVASTMSLPCLEGEAAAEMVFDITNNPSRELEREQLYGQSRSVSVGDIVNVDGADWLCLSTGWWRL